MIARRRWLAWIVLCAVLFGTARAVALPEVCASTSSAQRRTAIDEAVSWIERNQNDNGQFLYRYDADADEVIPGYVWIRHAGTLMALAQVVGSGLDTTGDARLAYERGLEVAVDRLVRLDVDGHVRAGLTEGGWVSSGGTALLLLAMTESPIADPVLVEELGRHLLASIAPGPAGTSIVLELADRDLGFVSGSVSAFTTGEVAYALARLERLQPGRGWGRDVPSILDYLALHKANAEGFVPDMPDHWAAYTMSEMTKWSAESWNDVVGRQPGSFDERHIAWAAKQMGITSVMVRYESQRTNSGADRWLRGRTSLGSAIGTHGESIGGWFDVASMVDDLGGRQAGLRDRLSCNSSVITNRQIDSVRAETYSDPDRARGSWLWFDITQVDDQQHAVSALVAAERILDAGGEIPRRESLPHSWWLIVLAVIAVVNPGRLASASFRLGPSSAIIAAVLLVADRTILRWLDVSVPTAIVAAGVVTVVAAPIALVSRLRPPTPILALWRPEVIVLVIAAGGRPWAVVVGLASAVVLARTSQSKPTSVGWVTAMWAIVAIAGGIMLIVDGVYAV